jgi:hypothetical protein
MKIKIFPALRPFLDGKANPNRQISIPLDKTLTVSVLNWCKKGEKNNYQNERPIVSRELTIVTQMP